MPSRFTDLELRDPQLIAPISWDFLRSREKAVVDKRGFVNSREWAPVDQRRFRIEPESYRTEYSIANIGRLRAHRIADSPRDAVHDGADGGRCSDCRLRAGRRPVCPPRRGRAGNCSHLGRRCL
jgi:hypothetical protein